MSNTGNWGIEGFDTFDNHPYPLPGSFKDENEAREAARARLIHLEETQPTESSGGQHSCGIQDRVFVVRPDGTKYRYTM